MHFDAVVFPGQGAQKLGMAKDFVEKYPDAEAVFEKARQVLPFDIYALCFEKEDELNQTAFTQPCIVTAEMAMFNALKSAYHLSPSVFAGHSLGEYAAICAAGVLPLDVTLTIVYRRGELMQGVDIEGGMTAVIMDNIPFVELCEMALKKDVDVANDNSKQQVVLSGDKLQLDELIETLADHYAARNFRAVPLNVSAAFHSRYMEEIEETFHTFLQQFKDSFSKKNLHQVISNVQGGFYKNDVDTLIDALAKQLSHTVNWRDNMTAIVAVAKHILELGPNRPLRGFFKTLDVDVASVINVKNAEKVFQ